jgi:plastocyanin
MLRTHINHCIPTQVACVLGVILTVGCAMNLPNTSRTGSIHDITIEQEILPVEASANIGDEVRFVNHRTAAIKVIFLEGDLDKVSCQRGFRSMGMMREAAKIAPGDAASVCFNKPGFYSYTVRMTESVPGGEAIRSGSIQVGKVSTPSPKS